MESTYKQQMDCQGQKALQAQCVQKQNVILLDVRFALLTSTLLHPLFLEDFHFSLAAAFSVPLFPLISERASGVAFVGRW